MQGATRAGTARRAQSTSHTGIGKALRTARLLRRKTLEEASRDTRIRREHLLALEDERFDLLSGDVYVRGTLRSYSGYVGLDPNRVLRAYATHFGPPRPMLPHQPGMAPADAPRDPQTPLFRSSPTWAFTIGVALLVLAVLATLGLLSW
ncbi:MAG: helix-turn-helix domain-containing protein [Actinomycetota bacterium]|nr:helix-turn-helix domain-containing protein [Actinomycetota bacterium]